MEDDPAYYKTLKDSPTFLKVGARCRQGTRAGPVSHGPSALPTLPLPCHISLSCLLRAQFCATLPKAKSPAESPHARRAAGHARAQDQERARDAALVASLAIEGVTDE